MIQKNSFLYVVCHSEVEDTVDRLISLLWREESIKCWFFPDKDNMETRQTVIQNDCWGVLAIHSKTGDKKILHAIEIANQIDLEILHVNMNHEKLPYDFVPSLNTKNVIESEGLDIASGSIAQKIRISATSILQNHKAPPPSYEKHEQKDSPDHSPDKKPIRKTFRISATSILQNHKAPPPSHEKYEQKNSSDHSPDKKPIRKTLGKFFTITNSFAGFLYFIAVIASSYFAIQYYIQTTKEKETIPTSNHLPTPSHSSESPAFVHQAPPVRATPSPLPREVVLLQMEKLVNDYTCRMGYKSDDAIQNRLNRLLMQTEDPLPRVWIALFRMTGAAGYAKTPGAIREVAKELDDLKAMGDMSPIVEYTIWKSFWLINPVPDYDYEETDPFQTLYELLDQGHEYVLFDLLVWSRSLDSTVWNVTVPPPFLVLFAGKFLNISGYETEYIEDEARIRNRIEIEQLWIQDLKRRHTP